MISLAIPLVMASAILHAGWNLICKTRESPGAVFFLILTVGSALFWLPFALWVFRSRDFAMPAALWCVLALSGLANAVYYVGLGGAYRRSDISFAYPLVKALPILLVTVFCILAGTGKATFAGFAGVGALLLGSAFLPMKKLNGFSLGNYCNRSSALVLVAAVASAGYMLLDNAGMKMLSSTACALERFQVSMVYIFFENLLILPFLALFVALRGEERKQFGACLRKFPLAPLVTGVMCTLSYSLVLMAMSLADNVSLIVALRQLSVPLGMFAGIVLLKEPSHVPKLLGAALIVGGLLLVCLA